MPMIPRDFNDVASYLSELFHRVALLETKNPLEQGTVTKAGITVDALGTIRSDDFDGQLPNVAGTTGWALGGAGSSAIFNTMVLRNGIIGNDALTSPVTADYYEGAAPGTLTIPGSALATGTIPVPKGFSQAIVHATMTIGGTNSTSNADNIYCTPQIQGNNGQRIANSAYPKFAQSVTSAQAIILSGLGAGAVITLKAIGMVDTNGWTGGNGHISAQAIFLR